MYKTVRHGENSLQYKILAQQEEGLANVKCRKSRRGRAAGIATIVLLLVCGVIASAVLVPLILTNDFITLTGTFQKFSVSTLRKTHSGNHVVVIAKKPHGWNGSRQNIPPSHASAGTKVTEGAEGSLSPRPNSDSNIEMMTGGVDSAANGTAAFKTTSTGSDLKATTRGQLTSGSSDRNFRLKSTSSPTFPVTRGIHTMLGVKEENGAYTEIAFTENIAATTELPSVPHHHMWTFKSPASFISWSKNRMLNHPLSTALGAFFTVSFMVTLVVLLMRNISDRRNTGQKEPADLKEDKTMLLKPSTRGSDEE